MHNTATLEHFHVGRVDDVTVFVRKNLRLVVDKTLWRNPSLKWDTRFYKVHIYQKCVGSSILRARQVAIV